MLIPRSLRAVVVPLVFALLAIVPLSASAQTEDDVERAEDQVDAAEHETLHARDRWVIAQDELEAALFELDDLGATPPSV